MGYDPTPKPASDHTALAAIDFDGRCYVFYYDGSDELYVLRSTSGKKYTYERVVDVDDKPIYANQKTHPIAVTSNRDHVSFPHLF